MANSNSKTQRIGKAADETVNRAFAATEEALNAFPTFEVPEFFRSFAEQGLSQTRDAYLRVKGAAEETVDLLESSVETGRESAREMQLKALDMAKANTDASFEFARRLLATSSVADAWQIQTEFARERFEAFVGFSKDLQSVATKASAEAGKPAKALVERTFSFARAA